MDGKLREAKLEATKIVEQADKRGAKIIDEAKAQARLDAKKLLEMARGDIEQEWKKARESLGKEIAGIALATAEKLLKHKLDASANSEMIDQLIEEVSGE